MPTVKPTTEDADGRIEILRQPRSWLRWAIAAFATLLVFEGVARLVGTTDPVTIDWYDAATQQRVEMMDQRTARVVFAGTSMAWQGFAPDTFTANDAASRTAFNAGLAGAVPVVMEPWLVDQVEPRLDPDIVVWGLSSLDFAPNYGDTQLEAYYSARMTREGWLASAERRFSAVSSLIRLRPLLRRPAELIGAGASEVRTDLDEAAAITGDGGERLEFNEDTGSRRKAVISARLDGYTEADVDDIGAIRRTVKTLRERGVEVVFVALPVPERFVELHPDGDAGMAATIATIEQLGVALEVDVLDAHDLFDDSDFVDYTHLNEASVSELSAYVAPAMAWIDEAEVDTCGELPITDELGFPLGIRFCRNN